MKRSPRVLGGALLALASGCQGASLEVLHEAPEEGACSVMPEADPCATLARFEGVQNVHGLAQPYELCELPPTTFRVNDGAWKLHPELAFPQVVAVRVGWSSFGLHFHARVFDPVVVISADDELQDGDSVEIYVAATADLHGPIDGISDGGAERVIIAPPQGSVAARARIEYQPRPGVTETAPPRVDRETFAATLVPDGYAVEAQLAWPIDDAPPGPGAQIGFDIALNVADHDAATGREQQSVLGYRLPAVSDCVADPPSAGPRPSCDDRTWCTPTLE